jgi:hypothetical protein
MAILRDSSARLIAGAAMITYDPPVDQERKSNDRCKGERRSDAPSGGPS